MPDCWLDLPFGSLGWFQAHTSTDELRISPRPGPLPVSASLQSSTVISPALKPETQESSLTTHPSRLPALHPPPPISGQIHHCFLLRSLSNPPTLLHPNHQGSTAERLPPGPSPLACSTRTPINSLPSLFGLSRPFSKQKLE